MSYLKNWMCIKYSVDQHQKNRVIKTQSAVSFYVPDRMRSVMYLFRLQLLYLHKGLFDLRLLQTLPIDHHSM